MARLTKKHFVATAALIRQIPDEKKRTAEIEKAITSFLKCNPNFDQERFRLDCMGEKPVRTKPSESNALPPGTSYQHLVTVSTGEWFDCHSQFKELWRVTYQGVTYDLDKECRYTNHYPKNHVWAGQVESQGIDLRHVFEQFVGRKSEYNCGKCEVSAPNYQLKDFLCDFLFNVKGCEHIEACTAYECVMTFTVEQKNVSEFERDLKKIYNILRQCKFEFEDEKPPEEE